MIKTVFIRHGDIGRKNQYIGKTDLPLSSLGKKQVENLLPLLVDLKITTVYCSPFLRCRQSYDCLKLSVPPQLTKEIREVDFGDWEEKTFSEISAESPGLIEKWATMEGNFTFPEGENLTSFHSRIISFVETKLKNHTEEIVLIITHGGVIRHLVCYLLGLSFNDYLKFKIDYGSLTVIDLFESGGVLESLNVRYGHG